MIVFFEFYVIVFFVKPIMFSITIKEGVEVNPNNKSDVN